MPPLQAPSQLEPWRIRVSRTSNTQLCHWNIMHPLQYLTVLLKASSPWVKQFHLKMVDIGLKSKANEHVSLPNFSRLKWSCWENPVNVIQALAKAAKLNESSSCMTSLKTHTPGKGRSISPHHWEWAPLRLLRKAPLCRAYPVNPRTGESIPELLSCSHPCFDAFNKRSSLRQKWLKFYFHVLFVALEEPFRISLTSSVFCQFRQTLQTLGSSFFLAYRQIRNTCTFQETRNLRGTPKGNWNTSTAKSHQGMLPLFK